MTRKKKGELPSGHLRTRVYIGKDAEGKRLYKSITAPTREDLKAAVIAYKAELAAEKADPPKPPGMTVAEAVRHYIDVKRPVLSPATVRAYEINFRNHIEKDPIGAMETTGLTAQAVQYWISTMSECLAPKSVQNIHTLLTSTMKMVCPDWAAKVTLPQKTTPDLYCPSDADVSALLDAVTDRELRISILLAAFGPMRRSEICGLRSSDIQGNIVTVRRALVLDPDGVWREKGPKTPGSFRSIEYPDFVISELKGIKGRIVTANPNQISDRFRAAMKRSGCPVFRFHDLRHYGASIMHAIGVPDQYIMERGGWSSDHVMKRVYRNVIRDEKTKQTEKINSHFSGVVHVVVHRGAS